MLRQVDRWLARQAGGHLLVFSTIGARRRRKGRVVALGVEQLESRAMLAGAPCSAPEPCVTFADPASEARVALILEVTQPDGSPLTTLSAGQEFVLHVLSEDLRSVPRGVFAAYLDIAWDGSKAEVAGPLTYGSEYINGSRDHVSVSAGSIDEGGAFAGLDELAGGRHEVFSVPMRALNAGDVVFTADPAEDLIDQVLVYDTPESKPIVPPEEIQFGHVAITIAPAAEPPLTPADPAPVEATSVELVVDSAVPSDPPPAPQESLPDTGGALAAAISAESARASTGPTSAAPAEANAKTAQSNAPSLLVDALLSSSPDDQLATLTKSSGENSDATIDPALQAGNLADDNGPL
jgi:hypothetical protein